jgi:Tfp pilus assembly protein PilV
MRARCSPRRAEAGFAFIEMLMGALLIMVAASGLLGAFDSARHETSYGEKQNTAAAIAEKELLRVTALPWEKIALNSASSWTAQSTKSTDPTSYLSAGPCDTSASLPSHSPCYQYDWTSSSSIEPLVTSASGYDPESDPYAFTTLTAKGSARLSGSVYRYINWVYDANCTGTGNTCGGATDYKRITVAVTVTGLNTPVVLSTLLANPVGGTNSPLANGATCLDGGVSVSCTH